MTGPLFYERYIMEDVKRVDRKLEYKGKILEIYKDTMEFSNGNSSKWDFVHHHGAAAVVPVDDDGKILMVSQYRPGTDRQMLEIPAGCLDAGESRMEAARRELEEETGYYCSNIELLIKYHSAPAYCDEYIEIFLARDLKKGKQKLDTNEFLNVYKYDVDELKEMIFNGDITDGKTICAILAYKEKYLK